MLLGSTVDRWLDSLEEAFGGIQAAVLWSGYTNMGVDNRDQFELMRSLPGGTAALRRVVDAMHARGVKALLPCAQPSDGPAGSDDMKTPVSVHIYALGAGAHNTFAEHDGTMSDISCPSARTRTCCRTGRSRACSGSSSHHARPRPSREFMRWTPAASQRTAASY